MKTTLSILLQTTGNFKTAINGVLNDYGLPLFGLIMFIGVLVGIVKNWDAINDSSGSGRKKEGFFSLLYIIGYVLLGCAILYASMYAISNVSFSLS